MSSNLPSLQNFFDKSPAGIEKFWKLYLHLLFSSNPENKTRKSLKALLKVSSANVTQILNVLELKELIYFQRDRSLGERTKEYVEFNIENILYYLGIEGRLEENKLEEFVEYSINLLNSVSNPIEITEEWYSLFNKADSQGKFLTVLVKAYPPIFFLLPLLIHMFSSLESVNKEILQEFPSVFKEWFEGFYSNFIERIIEKILPQVRIPGFGKLGYLEQTSNVEDKIVSKGKNNVDDKEIPNLSYFDLLEHGLFGLGDGYMIKGRKLHISLPLDEEIIQNTSEIQKINIELVLNDDQRISIPVEKSWMMDFKFFKE